MTKHLAAPPGITDYVPGGENTIPGGAKARDSRGLGKWYHEQGRFTPIYYDDVMGDIAAAPQGLIELRNTIKPGSVLWFARQQPTSEAGLDGLFVRGTTGAHINHMGTVRAVTRDEDGNIIGFEMYHGRREGKTRGCHIGPLLGMARQIHQRRRHEIPPTRLLGPIPRWDGYTASSRSASGIGRVRVSLFESKKGTIVHYGTLF